MKPVCRMESAAERLPESLCVRAPGSPSLRSVLAICLCSVVLSGCQSTVGQRSAGLFTAATSPAVNAAKNLWNGSGSDSKSSVLALGTKFSAEGRDKVLQANEIYERGDYAAAAKQYEKITEKYKETSAGEEAQYRLAECYFALKRYPAAQDGFDQLFVDYPSTRFVQPATKRLYEIAQNWLDLADPAHRSEIRTVSAVEVEYLPPEDAPPPPSAPSLKWRMLPNFTDRSRPVFDTQGRALKALKGIWLNDPTGPLADDALMATASYYLRQEDYVEADRYFKILREEYPESPHIKPAFLLGSHVRLMAYQGPSYDGASLAGADKLTAQSLSMFPDSQERQQLRKDLQKIHLLKAQRLWHRVLYYEQKQSDRAVGLTCVQLMNEFPETKFADMARDRLRQLDPAELRVLPGFDEILQSLSEQPRAPARDRDGNRPRVKTVSATAEDRNG